MIKITLNSRIWIKSCVDWLIGKKKNCSQNLFEDNNDPLSGLNVASWWQFGKLLNKTTPTKAACVRSEHHSFVTDARLESGDGSLLPHRRGGRGWEPVVRPGEQGGRQGRSIPPVLI